MKSSKIITIIEFKNRETISTLEKLLEKAKDGKLSGLIYAARLGDLDHGVGVTGAYREDPISGLGAVGRAFDILNQEARKLMRTTDL